METDIKDWDIEAASAWILAEAESRSVYRCDAPPTQVGMSCPLLHEGEDKSLRLILAALTTPLDLNMADTARNKLNKVIGETYWMDAFAGPPIQPEDAMTNTLFSYEVPLLSLRKYAWLNFMSVMVVDLLLFGQSKDDKSLRGLFHRDAHRFVRVYFRTGKVVGRTLSFTVLVLDTEALISPSASEISNVPQSKFVSSICLGDRIWMHGTDSYGVIVAIKSPKTGALGTARRARVTEVRVSFDEANKTDEWHEVMPAFRGILVSSFWYTGRSIFSDHCTFGGPMLFISLNLITLLQMNLLR